MGDFVTDINLMTGAVNGVSEPKYSTSQTGGATETTDFSSLVMAQLEEASGSAADTPKTVSERAEERLADGMSDVVDTTDMCYASSLIGKEVVVSDYSSGKQVARTVQITGSGMWNGEQVVRVNEEFFSLNCIIEIHRLPSPAGEENMVAYAQNKDGGEPTKIETPNGPDYDDGIEWPLDPNGNERSKGITGGQETTKEAAPLQVQMPTMTPKAVKAADAGDEAVEDLLEAMDGSDEDAGGETAALDTSVGEEQLKAIRSYLQGYGISYSPNATSAELVALLNEHLDAKMSETSGYAGQDRAPEGSAAEQRRENDDPRDTVQAAIPMQEM